MAILIATYGGSGANSYVSLVDANSYIQASKIYFDEWALAEDKQEQACVQATRDIDSRNWIGYRWFYYQMLEFPRLPPDVIYPYGSFSRADPDDSFVNLTESDEFQRKMKIRVKQATCEQALWRLRSGGYLSHREAQFQGIRSQSRSLRFSESFGYGDPDQVLCSEAWDLMRYYRGSPRLVRGDSGSSTRVY